MIAGAGVILVVAPILLLVVVVVLVGDEAVLEHLGDLASQPPCSAETISTPSFAWPCWIVHDVVLQVDLLKTTYSGTTHHVG